MSSSKLLTKPKLKSKCKELHYSIHCPNKTISWCNDCEANVELIDKKFCGCCRREVERIKSHAFLRKVLSVGIVQHKSLIKCWSAFPTKEPIYAEIILKGGLVCEINIKYLALANENLNPADVLPLIEKHLRIKGYKFRIPEENELTVNCTKCNSELKVQGKSGIIYCPTCITKLENSESLLR